MDRRYNLRGAVYLPCAEQLLLTVPLSRSRDCERKEGGGSATSFVNTFVLDEAFVLHVHTLSSFYIFNTRPVDIERSVTDIELVSFY